jgi:protein-tyrosine phosphatase
VITILIVCEGNVCRSPYVECVLRARLDAVAPGAFVVTSAGTAAQSGAAMFPRSAEAVVRRGGDPAGFSSTPLTSEVLAGRGLVLTMERGHRAAVLDLAPALLRRTFTLREFERLVRPLLDQGDVDADFWDAFPRSVARSRVATAPVSPDDDDITDPVRGDATDHDRMCGLADAAIDAVLACAARTTEGARDARIAGA